MAKELELLPIGSVVKVKGINGKIMITSYGVVERINPSERWDYGGVIYPIGALSSKSAATFYATQITNIFFKGYQDDDVKKFLEALSTELEGLKVIDRVISKNGGK